MILEKIANKTKEHLQTKTKPISELLAKKRTFRDVKKALTSTPENPYRIISEIKKASPSKGVIREDFDPIAIAKAYMKEADAISILTEPFFFQGSLNYLEEISTFSTLPLLRKDFILDEYQIAEAYYYGADFILLIAKMLDQETLKRLYDYAKSLGLEVLLEVHDIEDTQKANAVGADIVGFNHRNLETFEMDMDLSKKLMPLLSKEAIIIAESGLTSHQTLADLHKNGVDGFLIGEHFMRQEDLGEEICKIKGKV